ncbi:hypothetical protein J3F83DRAFT_626223 [Trichoderma novae-zelandiae]
MWGGLSESASGDCLSAAVYHLNSGSRVTTDYRVKHAPHRHTHTNCRRRCQNRKAIQSRRKQPQKWMEGKGRYRNDELIKPNANCCRFQGFLFLSCSTSLAKIPPSCILTRNKQRTVLHSAACRWRGDESTPVHRPPSLHNAVPRLSLDEKAKSCDSTASSATGNKEHPAFRSALWIISSSASAACISKFVRQVCLHVNKYEILPITASIGRLVFVQKGFAI